jgi:hypothetical protein
MSEQPIRKGDKIRITTHVVREAPVESLDDACVTVIEEDGCRHSYGWNGDHTFEILERADDPSRDLVGTVAEFEDLVWVKTGERVWVEVGDPDHFRADAAITGRTVTGAVPGTPAAEAQGEPKATTGVAATCSATKRLGNGQLIRCSNASWHEATTEHYARHAGQDVFW